MRMRANKSLGKIGVALFAVGVSTFLSLSTSCPKSGTDNTGTSPSPNSSPTPAPTPGPGPGPSPSPHLGGDANSISLTLVNNCGAGVPLNVLVNANGVWKSGGATKCEAGQQCSVTAGTYPLDLGSSGLDFFAGSSVNNATKAEITYIDVLTYDISTISDSNCPDSCTAPSCCQNGFNQSVQISTNPTCRCLNCTSVTCPDAYHWPHDDTKQVRCDPEQGMNSITVTFCPTSSCPSTGFANCTAAQQTICATAGNQPCAGNQAICCPQASYGGSHACYCETKEQYCAVAPDAGSGCGASISNYCYVNYQQ